MTATQAQPSLETSSARSFVVNGLLAVLAASAAAVLVAALARAVGVDFELPDGEESIPLSGFGVVTTGFTLVGLALAAALQRWARHPFRTFVRVTVALTALSLVPTFLVDANLGTVAALVLLHLVVAAIAIPMLARRLSA